jgi:hypothetical protein
MRWIFKINAKLRRLREWGRNFYERFIGVTRGKGRG